jgi:hypothetical protein
MALGLVPARLAISKKAEADRERELDQRRGGGGRRRLRLEPKRNRGEPGQNRGAGGDDERGLDGAKRGDERQKQGRSPGRQRDEREHERNGGEHGHVQEAAQVRADLASDERDDEIEQRFGSTNVCGHRARSRKREAGADWAVRPDLGLRKPSLNVEVDGAAVQGGSGKISALGP